MFFCISVVFFSENFSGSVYPLSILNLCGALVYKAYCILEELYVLYRYLIIFSSDQLTAMVLVIPPVNVLPKEELLPEIVLLGKLKRYVLIWGHPNSINHVNPF